MNEIPFRTHCYRGNVSYNNIIFGAHGKRETGIGDEFLNAPGHESGELIDE